MGPAETSPPPRIDRGSLPPAARRWLDRALPEGTEVPEGVELRERGEFLMDPRWARWKGTHLIWQDEIGFEWQAGMRVFGALPLRVVDGCDPTTGWGRARLLRIVPVRRPKGIQVMRSQLVRYLAELPLAPGAALLNASLKWVDEGEGSVGVRAAIGEQEATVHLDVDEHGDVVRSHAPDRPRDFSDGSFADTPFQCVFSEHAEIGGARIPARVEAAFDYGKGPEPYLRIEVLDTVAARS